MLYVFIPLLSLVMHLHVFRLDLVGYHVWRQTQTQTNIINFYEEDFNILNPRINNRGEGNGIFRMEFPIMQWLFAIFYKIFGNHIIISRILTFLIGVFSVLGMYHLIKAIFDNEKMAVIGAWCFNFSPVFYYYTLNPLPDNFALCCGIWGLAFFFSWLALLDKLTLINGHVSNHNLDRTVLSFSNKNLTGLKIGRYGLLWLCGLMLSLATLAKLPFILFSIIVPVYCLSDLINNRFDTVKRNFIILITITLCLFPAFLWYIWVIPTWEGNGIVFGILAIDKTEILMLLDILQFNLISTLPELLINFGSVLFFIAGFYLIFRNRSYKNPYFPLLLFLGTTTIFYFLFEMNMIGKVHDYYMFPFLPPIFLVVCYGAWHLISSQNNFIKRFSIFLLCILPLLAFLRINHRWDPDTPGFNKDLLIYKQELRSAVAHSAKCVAGNDISSYIYLYYIDKKGWVFSNNDLNYNSLKEMINKGAEYLYSDSRKIDENIQLKKLLDQLILQKGTIKVYSLKKCTISKK